MEVESKADNFDLVVTTGVFGGKVNTPVISGITFLTGVGVDKTIQEIMDKLNN